ncbi:uncharacterized protein LOC129001667 [Macrosteles quadrilineatus]|uniref:uncharacterized protein LOC129001667 n=1 Tax=Macrosteles quadrilineatus TaxID=74068 RepID=UPI0023E20805|nr:uncharacterized protein LOC129001667 [Macrosteles quadrilineatus]
MATTLDTLTCLLLLLHATTICVRGVQITQLFVPEEVRNGTSEAAILDCEYTLTPSDLATTSGLVVKWFFNNGPAPVYQWIPGQRPQDLGILKGRLRLDYRASSHESTMHRALYILTPTTELSGEYKCSVSTFEDEDFMVGKMIVIAPEKHLYLVQSRTPLERVNITCRANGVFPEPKMTLYREDVITHEIVEVAARVETIPRDYHYDIEATTTLQDEYLDTPTVFYCELYIPHTSYKRRKSVTYYPGSVESLSSVSNRAAATQSATVVLASLVLWLRLMLRPGVF